MHSHHEHHEERHGPRERGFRFAPPFGGDFTIGVPCGPSVFGVPWQPWAYATGADPSGAEEPRGRGGRGRPPFAGGGPRGGRGGRGRSFGGDGPFFGRGPKASRGDVRAAILALLDEEPMHGYQMIRELDERSGGVWRPSPGSVYPTLQQLEDEGLVRLVEADGRKVFHLTEAGQVEVSAREGGRPAPWDEVGGEVDTSVFELRDLVGQIGGAVRQVVHAGNPAQVQAAKVLLASTRKALYRILAEDESDA